MSIVISMMLQDGPFLVLRLLLIFRYDVLSYTNLFFTSKNTLVLVLQFYRLVVLFSQKKKDESTRAKTLQAEQSLQNGPEAGGGRGGGGGRRGGGRGGGGGGPHGSLGDAKDRRVRKTEPSAVVKFTREDDVTDDEGVTSDDDEDVMNTSEHDAGGKQKGRAAAKTSSSSKSPRSARRESFKRQQHAVLESPPTSTERDYDGNDPTGTPTSPSSSVPHSDAEAAVHAVQRLKAKAKAAGKRKASDDSTRGSMSGDSREDVRGGKRRGGAEKGFRRQRSAKEKWGDVKSLARAIAFVHDAGKYKTLVLKPVETADHQTVFMVESEQVTGINCV